jgi:hypothetical protein
MQIIELSTSDAQSHFERLPRALQLQSLSPEFAAVDALRDPELRCVHIAIENGVDQWLKSVHVRALPLGDCYGAQSPYGYGGVLCTTRDPDFLQAAWKIWQQWCVSRCIIAEFCRFHPHADDLACFAGVVRENRQTVSVDLRSPDYTSRFSAMAQRKIRKAHGVEIVWTQAALDWACFARYYRQAMLTMQATPFYLFPDPYFEAMSAMASAWLVFCRLDGVWLSAGAYLMGPELAEYHLGASAPEGLVLGTPYRMQAAAMQRARATGAHSLYLAGGTDPSPDNSLLFYKRSFGRRMLPFFVGEAIHDAPRYWALATSLGFTSTAAPTRIFFD